MNEREVIIQINNCRRNYGKRKLKFVEDCRYNWGKNLSMDTKVSGESMMEMGY